MEMKQLRTFLAVADARSFQKAASKLYITRQAVSKTIKQLEDELHVELFSRNHDGALMTPAGIFFYPRAATLVAEMDQLKKDTMDANRSYIPKIRIGMTQGLYSLYADALFDYDRDHKYEMNIQLRSCLEADCDNMLASRKADAVISFAPPVSSMTRTQVLFTTPVTLLVNRHSDSYDALMEEPELSQNMPLLLYTGGMDQPLWWSTRPRDIDIVSSDLGYLFNLLNTRQGIMPIPENLVGNYADYCGNLPVPETQAPVPIYWSTLYPDHYNRVTSSFLDVIHDEVFHD